MKLFIRSLYGIYFLCLIAGVLAVIPLNIPGLSVYTIDIVALLSLPIAIICGVKSTWLKTNTRIIWYGGGFVCVGILSLFVTPINLTGEQRLLSSLYLVRWLAYVSIYYLTVFSLEKKYITTAYVLNGLKITSVLLALLGWGQYVLYPNLRNLEYLGWDPHFERIFSTYLDPNYFGLLMILGIMIWVWPLLQEKKEQQRIDWLIVGFLLLTLLFTYSRSTYLTLLTVVMIYFLRQWKIVVGILSLFLLAFLLLPRPAGEGGKWERVYSIVARTQSWQSGTAIIIRYPFFGVGFNTLRYVKPSVTSVSAEMRQNHAGAGVDNSFIFVAATTGLIGVILFMLLLRTVYAESLPLGQLSLIAVVIHSLFQNSLFYAWVMLWLSLVLGTFRRKH